ncbi:hypothetical protein MMC17_003690 [Xylographa soralifera]|nr:hypothetical protein [Xylographa soralifera]
MTVIAMMSDKHLGGGLDTRITTHISSAFAVRPDLKREVYNAAVTYPQLSSLFTDISKYVYELRVEAGAGVCAEGPVTKRRKLNGESDNGLLNRPGTKSETMEADWPLVPAIEASFSVPQRKKLLLQVSRNSSEGIRALNPSSRQVEFGVRWKNIEHLVCLPVPEKAQATYNFCVFPSFGDGVSNLPDNSPVHEPMVWTVPEVKVKDATDKPNYRRSVIEAADSVNITVIEPNAEEFESQVQQALRKGEKSYHVKAFRGSKDGFLYFLSTGIVWAFKKPLYFFSFPIIASISYTSVLQRTFNLNITTQTSSPSNPSDTQSQDFEFSMVDQADFGGIDAYIKRHSLQDASMAEARRAKKLNINGTKGEKEAIEGDGERESELEKAAREVEGKEGQGAEDDEDEEEEDENFDPGSEGDSEGSGTSDEDDDEQGDGDRDTREEEGGEDEDEEE